MLDTIKEIEKLTGISALSGLEDKMITEVKNRFATFTDDVTVDRIGNVIAKFKGTDSRQPSMLVFAHVDEVGLMVSKVERDGYLRFERVGGVPAKTLPGQFVEVFPVGGGEGKLGFIGAYAHHLTPAEAKMKVPEHSEMYIDLGLSSAEEVYSLGINIGSAVTYKPNFQKMSDYRISSKTLDNRIGIYMLYELGNFLKDNPPAGDVYLVGSVQEEFNIRGVIPAFVSLKPDAAICLDITPACDTPDLKMRYDIALGRGPAITQLNFHGRGTLGGIIPHPKLRMYIEQKAAEIGVPIQREVIIGVITDDAFAQLTGDKGVPTAHISIPMRYSHAPIETSDVRDIQNGVKLLIGVVAGFNSELDLSRGI